jgi:predicted NBD/HSP70 family sugar kinase
MNVLVIDLGGTHVKLLASGQREPRRFDSGNGLKPAELVRRVREQAGDWPYEAVSLGYPGLVGRAGPTDEPGNLGDGWVGFDFDKAFECPVKVINDAAMQALGSYEGGRMLFLGLGTGLGSTLVSDKVLVPLELGCLPFRGATFADWLGKGGLARHGRAAWLEAVAEAVRLLQKAVAADHVVLGGGNAAEVEPLPAGAIRGGNENAFEGGFRLWEEAAPIHEGPPRAWKMV